MTPEAIRTRHPSIAAPPIVGLAILKVHAAIKRALDPHGILNRGVLDGSGLG